MCIKASTTSIEEKIDMTSGGPLSQCFTIGLLSNCFLTNFTPSCSLLYCFFEFKIK